MPRDVGRHRSQEAGDLRELGVRVVHARHHQGDDLQPEALLVKGADGPEHAVERPSQVAVGPVAEALQVDLVEGDVGPDVVQHLRGSVAVRDVRADEPRRLRLLEDGHRPLAGDERLVVGGGHDGRAPGPGQAHDLGGSDDVRKHAGLMVPQGLRGEPVLAVADREEARQVAVVFFNLHVVDVAVVGLTRDATQGHQVVVGDGGQAAPDRGALVPDDRVLCGRLLHPATLNDPMGSQRLRIEGRRVATTQGEPGHALRQGTRHGGGRDLAVRVAMAVPLHVGAQECSDDLLGSLSNHRGHALLRTV